MNWVDIQVAADTTHHVRDGKPIYGARFDEVHKFHPPGLAPVRLGNAAWHIEPSGRAAYARRFYRTFGYYEGVAAVVDDRGWHHVQPDGMDLGVDTFAWCGNFQDTRCSVRDHAGRYHHITLTGARAYAEDWRYAGDFRDHVAVVQAEDGLSTHIDRDGRLLHERWFLDLDVFHKGFARARDERGWMHIDRGGRPAYRTRFAGIEPFYNGQARVERLDGGLVVIDESGETLVELRPALRSEFAALSADLVGYWRTQTLRAAVELGVFDALPATERELADRCGLMPDRTHRLLRALRELHVVELEESEWRASARGALLRSDHVMTLVDAALEYGGELGAMWQGLADALKDGGEWIPPDIFGDVAREPSRVNGHHRMLRSYARHDYAAVSRALKLNGFERVIDAGGGVGGLAEGLLQEHDSLHIVLLDRPEVVRRAAVPPHVASRFTACSADIFQPWPVRGDAVVLARVLHDWDDRAAAAVLSHARASLPVGGRLFVIEMLLSDTDSGGGLCDLHLLTATGGKERTLREFEELLSAASFALDRVERLPAVPCVIVGVAR